MRAHKLTRLFIEHSLPGNGTIALDREQSHYLATVMRMKAGAEIAVFNGKDGEWLGEIAEVNKRAVSLAIKSQTRDQSAEPDVWLAFAPIKKARLDFVAQKATELGVSRLIPIMTRRTIVDRVKTDRMTANAIEAAEQCERTTVPEVSDPIGLEQLLNNWPKDRMIMFCDEDLTGTPAHDALATADQKTAPKGWAILIGPEGGFDDHERDLIKSHPNCITVSLGPRVLRADTAAMAAITLWQSAIGDW